MNMLRTIKRFWWIALLVLGAQPAWGFALLGPNANGGDSWQTVLNGFNPNPSLDSALTGPKNIGEEYRQNKSVIFYAYDANFLGFFGSNGAASVDQAFVIMNRTFATNPVTGQYLTNGVDSFDLSQYPPYSQHINYQAQQLGLTDIKSTTLWALVEQMGLAWPERYTWTLHDEYLPPSTAPAPPAVCPADEVFEVVQRNFDIYDTPLNQVQYSPYVNDTLYTFNILYWPNCRRPAGFSFDFITGDGSLFNGVPNSDTDNNPYIPFPVDPFAQFDSAVAATGGQLIGGFFTGLTRDDVAGLRYLLTTNNVNTESAAPGAFLRGTNSLGTQTIPTQSFGPLAAALTNDPATLQGLFPGLLVSTVTNVGVVATTNITAFYTNQSGTGVTNFLTILSTNATSDLGLLLQRAATNDPATLQALYPGLLLSTVTNVGVVTVTNITAFYTNQPGPTVTNRGTQIQLNPPPNQVPPPITHGTIDFGLFTLRALTNSTPDTDTATAIAQLEAFYPGLVIVSATPNDDLTEVDTTNFVTSLVPNIGAPVGSPPLQVTTISGIYANYVQRYTYVFGNVMMDSNGTFYPFVDYNTSRSLYNTNETVTIQTIAVTNLTGAPVGSPLATNITTVTVRVPGITGDFFIMPTNWCGFTIKQALAVTPLVSYTNTITATGTTNAIGVAQWTQNTIHTYTNHQFQVWPGICQPVLQFTTNYTTAVVITYQNTLLNVYTNSYFPTSLQTVLTTNIFTTNGAPAGTLVTNRTSTNITVSVPTGDFFLIPTNWCGFQIVRTLLTNVVYTTNTTLTAGPVPIFSSPGVVSGIQELFSQTVITSFTNHNLVIQQGICEPLLVFSTNVTSAVATNYQNTLLNIYTNYYAPTSIVTVITTNIFTTNGAPVGTLVTNVTTTNLLLNLPTGDFFIIPANWCGFTVVSTLLTNVVYTTNTTFSLQVPLLASNGVPLPQLVQYSQTVITSSTNHILRVDAWACVPVADVPRLRQGIEKIQFVRANFDSLLSQFFVPVTNNYTMVAVTNSQLVTLFFQRIVTQPDILLTANDEPLTTALPFYTAFGRSIAFDTANVLPNLAGPGTITSPATFSYNKAGNLFLNGSMATVGVTTNSFLPYLSEITQSPFGVVWASFDASTNDPVVYPNGTSIQNLFNQMLIQVTPPAGVLPDGTNAMPYANITFSATGGSFSPPYTWGTAPSGLGQLPPGLSWINSVSGMPNDTITGTPSLAGTFDFTVQLTDSLGRSVTWNYRITIH